MQELTSFDPSMAAWEKALSLLSGDNLSPADLKLKEQCEEGLKGVKDRIANPTSTLTGIPKKLKGQLPWDRALALRESLIAAGDVTSSVSDLTRAPSWTALITTFLYLCKLSSGLGYYGCI